MTFKVQSSIAIAAALAAGIVLASPASAQTLTATEIKVLMADTSVTLINPHGIPSKWTFTSTGAVQGEAYLKDKTARDNGTWWTEDGDRLCHKWANWSGKKTFCYRLARNGDRVERFDEKGAKLEHPFKLIDKAKQGS